MALQPNDKRTLKKANLPFLRILYFKPANITHGILQYVSKQDEGYYNTLNKTILVHFDHENGEMGSITLPEFIFYFSETISMLLCVMQQGPIFLW